MNDYFLRCDTKKTMEAALKAAGFLEEVKDDKGKKQLVPTMVMYTVGTIYEETGALDAEGNPQMQPIDGWHVNLRGNLTQEQIEALPIIDRPNKPQCVFAS